MSVLDPTTAALLLLSLVLLLALVLPRLRPRWPVWLRMTLRVTGLAAATVLVQRSFGPPLAPRFAPADTDIRLWQQLLEAGWWVLAGRVAVGAARLFVVLKHRPRETQILSDLLAGAIYVATALAVTTFAFSVPLGGLLATSGVIAIVLGLALQSTLSDVFSGIAVGLEKPYVVGDFLWVEGGIEGRVIQVNWRATQIGTADGNVASIPNSVIAKARLVNRSAPTPRRSASVDVKLNARASPSQCVAVLRAAVRQCAGILDQPEPTIRCSGLEGDGVGYKVTFSVAGSDVLLAAKDELLTRIHVHLYHAGIALAVPGKKNPGSGLAPTLQQLMAGSDLFGAMDDAHRAALAGFFEADEVAEGDVLMRQGDVPAALLVIASGTVGVSLTGPEGPRIVNRLGPGETLGAAGLVTGQPFSAVAAALTPLLLYRMPRTGLAAAMAATPELAGPLQKLAERVFQAMRRDAVSDDAVERVQSEILLHRLRDFLRSLNENA
jgi:small-conductance mechanosensitive channel/CRP-like cAMP-binding protein